MLTSTSGYFDAEGAARETWEEANCQVEILAPYSHFDIPVIGQAYILFRSTCPTLLCHYPCDYVLPLPSFTSPKPSCSGAC